MPIFPSEGILTLYNRPAVGLRRLGYALMAKYCSQCGNPLKDGSRFCTQCGTPAKSPKTDASEAKPSQRAQSKTIAIIAAAVAVLSLIAAIACFVLAKTEDTGSQTVGYAAYSNICQQRI